MAIMMMVITKAPKGIAMAGSWMKSMVASPPIQIGSLQPFWSRDIARTFFGLTGNLRAGARRDATPAHPPLQHEDAEYNEQHGPKLSQVLKDADAQIVEKEKRPQTDEERRPDGRVHFHLPQSKPLGNRLAKLLGASGLVGIDDHIEVERGRSQPKNRVHGSGDAMAEGDQGSKKEHLNHGLHNLTVVDSAHAGNEAQGQSNSGTRPSSRSQEGRQPRRAQASREAILAVDHSANFVLALGAQRAAAVPAEDDGIGFRMFSAFHRDELLVLPAGLAVVPIKAE